MDQKIYWTEFCREVPFWVSDMLSKVFIAWDILIFPIIMIKKLLEQDYNLSWNTTSPRLTSCFQLTVMIWFPSLFLWFSGLIEVILAIKRNQKKPFCWKKISLSEAFLLLFCAFTYFIEVFSITFDYGRNSNSSIPAHFIAIFLEILNYVSSWSSKFTNLKHV